MTQAEIFRHLTLLHREPRTVIAFVLPRPAGFEIAFQGPDLTTSSSHRSPGRCADLLKEVGVAPVPNYTRDIGKGMARWDAFVIVPDPDALAAEFAARGVEFFSH
jgi:hypothetical protein